jgi:hypothetical protein
VLIINRYPGDFHTASITPESIFNPDHGSSYLVRGRRRIEKSIGMKVKKLGLPSADGLINRPNWSKQSWEARESMEIFCGNGNIYAKRFYG